MAASNCQLPGLEKVYEDRKVYGFAWKDFCRNSSSIYRSTLMPTYVDSKHQENGELLWIYGRDNTFLVSEKLITYEASLAGFKSDSLATSPRAFGRAKEPSQGTDRNADVTGRVSLQKCSENIRTLCATCEEIGDSKALLDMHNSKDVMAWTALMSSYIEEGQGTKALDLFQQMKSQDILPNAVTFVCALKACGRINAIDKGKQIHDEISSLGLLQTNILLGGALVDMYVKCQALSEAHRVLKVMPFRNVVTWNALISGYAQEGKPDQALSCFEEMQHEGIFPSASTYTSTLKACAMIRAVDDGRQIHSEITAQGLVENNIILGSALVDMYAKCSSLPEAEWVFEVLPTRDAVVWNAMIAGYLIEEGEAAQALHCFELMCHNGMLPNAATYVCALKACAAIKAAEVGRRIHNDVAKQGLLQENVVVAGALVDMYAKCGAILEAREVLEELPFRNVVTWNALLGGYVHEGEANEALNCFGQMKHEGIQPNVATYVSILKGCAMMKGVDRGEQIHLEIVSEGLLQKDIALGNALVDMYAKCGVISDAGRVFHVLSRDAITWNVLMAAHTEGDAEQALNCLVDMQNEGFQPDAITYTLALKACAKLGAAEIGRDLHAEIVKKGMLPCNSVVGCAVGDMYSKCGGMSEARWAFEKLRSRDIISWNSMIAGYVQEGQGEQALNLFEQMYHESVLPDALTYVYALKACGLTKAADKGREIHSKLERQDLFVDKVLLGNAVVDMYIKCGKISDACRIFEKLPYRDVIAWNALIAFYAQEGQAEKALQSFEQMEREGTSANAATYTCMLILCSHHGLLAEGEEIFAAMCSKYGVNPSIECYTSMIDLFGRAGLLSTAVRFIQELPSSGYDAVWHSLLGSCWNWADINVGGWAFKQAMSVDKMDGPAYVLMSNLCIASGIHCMTKYNAGMKTLDKAWTESDSTWQFKSSNTVHDTILVQDMCTKLKTESNKISRSENLLALIK